MNILKGILAVFIKDIHSELRTRYALNAVLAFTGSALLLILFALQPGRLNHTAQSGLIWIIILFAALSSLARSFVSEAERQTFNLLRLHSDASAVFGGKFLYNFVFTLIVNALTLIFYLLVLNLSLASPMALLLTLLFGSSCLCSIATFLASVVSQADRKGAIFSVLTLPLLFPIMLVLVDATQAAIFKGMTGDFLNYLWAMIGYTGATLTAGFLLFEYIWEA